MDMFSRALVRSPADSTGGGSPLEGLGAPRGADLVITIDGPAASGKSTLGLQLARYCNVPLIDTGAFYRALGYLAPAEGVNLDNLDIKNPENKTLQKILQLAKDMDLQFKKVSGSMQQMILNGEKISHEDIHNETVSMAAAAVASISEVRNILNEKIRALAIQRGGVLVGRDCGTEVCPEAPLKIYLAASPETRAKRRLEEYHPEIDTTSDEYRLKLAEQLKLINERDRMDSVNSKSAADAKPFDTTPGEPEKVFESVKPFADQLLFEAQKGDTVQ